MSCNRSISEKVFRAGDELLKAAALIIQQAVQSNPEYALARLTGGDFGIFLSNTPPDNARQIAADMANALSQLAVQKISDSGKRRPHRRRDV